MDHLKPSPSNSPPLTPISFLDRAATACADSPSIIYNSAVFTWSATRRRCLQLASSISSVVGITRGQVVSVLSPNTPAMYELHFAAPMAAAVLNAINTRLDARTISVLLRHSESKLVFVDYFFSSLILEAVSLLPPGVKPPLLVLITDDDEAGESQIAIDFIDTYEGLMKKGDPGFEWIRPSSEWDPIALNYTSGTTSSPKGVVHCHRSSFIMAVDCLIDWSVMQRPVYLWTLPMFHSNGWSLTWGMAAVGGTNICLKKVDPANVYRLINDHDVTHMCCAPVVLNMLSNSPNRRTLKSPVNILTGGAPPPAAVLLRTEALGFVVSHGYGLTETGGTVVTCAWKPEWNRFPAAERARLKARQGVRTIGMAEVDVVNPETGESVKRDGASVGEIVLRGGCIMLGYLKDPAATARCMTEEGWFYTGDLAVMHPDGYLEIKDRSKDVIITGGENLSSVEVESVLYTNPGIYEAAVVARPDEFWGETPCAFVSLRNNGGGKGNSEVEKEIKEYCRERMPHFMVPKTVVVVKEELPKTSTGKIQKYVLREMARAMGKSTGSRL